MFASHPQPVCGWLTRRAKVVSVGDEKLLAQLATTAGPAGPARHGTLLAPVVSVELCACNALSLSLC